MSNTSTRVLFYSLLTVLNLIQANYTGLLYDEANYWYASFYMDWGHFYHPPLIDVLDQAGYFLLGNRLGLRLFFIILSVISVYLLEKLIRPKQLLLYYLVISTIVFLQIGGIFAVLDIPLFFLAVCFFSVVKLYMIRSTLGYSILLGVISSLMLYAKYHGIIVIVSSFLFLWPIYHNKSSFYLWPLIALLLFLPHLYWQISHQFPTFNFHLFNRPSTSWFEFRNLDYIPGQLLLAGPITGFFMFYGVYKRKMSNRFEKLLLVNLFAIYIFFLAISLYTHIEMNWGLLALIPLIILGYKALEEMPNLQGYFKKTVVVSLILSFVLRLVLLFPGQSPIGRLDKEMAGWEQLAHTIDSLAKGKPVVMMTRYQHAVAYAFYSENKFVHVSYPDQPSDFYLMGTEKQVLNKAVLLCSKKPFQGADSVKTIKGKWYYKDIPKFKSLSFVKVEAVKPNQINKSLEYRLLLEKNESPDSLNGELSVKYYNNEAVLALQNLGGLEYLGLRTVEVPRRVAETQNVRCQFFVKAGDLMPMPCSLVYDLSFESN
ncbi:ArnT family glycosyltransferase [Mangrovimonas aestuarii]|uniref:ArnT family glycosyltransferase n=1 Tax=Mangrovimonas aestuarii TaxID=3018443 RepID=UPI0023797836|nr:hypothetical protein [Mangrovimonas aestuarii]